MTNQEWAEKWRRKSAKFFGGMRLTREEEILAEWGDDWESAPVVAKVEHYLLQVSRTGIRDHSSELHYLRLLLDKLEGI